MFIPDQPSSIQFPFTIIDKFLKHLYITPTEFGCLFILGYNILLLTEFEINVTQLILRYE